MENTSSRMQRAGGIAALIDALAFIIGFALFLTRIDSENYGGDGSDPIANAQFLADNEILMYAWNMVIYVVFGIALVVLSLALLDRLNMGNAGTVQVATAFGLIWSGLVIATGMVANIGASAVIDLLDTDPEAAGSAWITLDFVTNGLGGGNEIVGGIWVVLVSIAAIQSSGLPRALNYLGIVIGLAGISTTIPALEDVGAIFGLGLIVWFIWVGLVMVRNPHVSRSPAALTA